MIPLYEKASINDPITIVLVLLLIFVNGFGLIINFPNFAPHIFKGAIAITIIFLIYVFSYSFKSKQKRQKSNN